MTRVTLPRRVTISLLLVSVCFISQADELLHGMPNFALPGIIGHDDRVPLNSGEWPWLAIGRINQPEARAHCTGTLIAANAVLTAAHCVFDHRLQRWLQPQEIVFVAGYREGVDEGYARGLSIRRSNASPQMKKPSLASIAEDWAILYLERSFPIRPVPLQELPISASAQELASVQVQTAGYARDRPYVLSWDQRCNVKSRLFNDQVLLTDCDSTQGESGAPLLMRKSKDFMLVGVFSAATMGNAKVPGSFAVDTRVFINELGKGRSTLPSQSQQSANSNSLAK